jgi:uncharacterized membrane protein YqiK
MLFNFSDADISLAVMTLLIVVGIVVTGVTCYKGQRFSMLSRINEPLEVTGGAWQTLVDV